MFRQFQQGKFLEISASKPQKTHMTMENPPFEDVFALENGIFQFVTLVFRGVNPTKNTRTFEKIGHEAFSMLKASVQQSRHLHSERTAKGPRTCPPKGKCSSSSSPIHFQGRTGWLKLHSPFKENQPSFQVQ